MYFAVHHLGADGGLQITGSHNPPDYNGFKMMLGSRPFYGAADPADRQDRRPRATTRTGEGSDRRDRRIRRPISTAWLPTITARGSSRSSGTPATAPPGRAMAALADRLPGRHKCLFAEVDGSFPNHHPDPTEPHNLEDLIREVVTGRLRARHRLRRRRRPDRRGRRQGPDRVRRPDPADPGGRRAGPRIPAPRSSPTSRPARCFFDEIARRAASP